MNTITAKYWGRTGNILFQIAAAIYYSNKQNRPFILDECEGFPKLEKYTAKSLGIDESEYKSSLCEYKETDIHNGVPFPENGNIMLSGFFQNYKYCDEYKDHILNVLGIHSIRSNVITKLVQPVFQSRRIFEHLYLPADSVTDITISLHIRHGDYENLQCYFILLDEYYYKNALMHILERLAIQVNGSADNYVCRRVNVICFYETKSQDPANRIIESLKNDPDLMQYPIDFYHFSHLYMQLENNDTKLTDVEEMVIMSYCDHNIIANSTFSWWASYINTSPNKIVCCPNEWYNHQLYYLPIDGFKANNVVMIPAWNKNKIKCHCTW